MNVRPDRIAPFYYAARSGGSLRRSVLLNFSRVVKIGSDSPLSPTRLFPKPNEPGSDDAPPRIAGWSLTDHCSPPRSDTDLLVQRALYESKNRITFARSAGSWRIVSVIGRRDAPISLDLTRSRISGLSTAVDGPSGSMMNN
jgi:hypothetical protein